MTERKFTDEEVIKALGCCINAETKRDCETGGCPALTEHGCYFYLRTNRDDENAFYIKLLNEALDLINRKNAEIERLGTENKILSENADTAFQDGLNEAQDLYAEQIRYKLRAEAITEFVERLKKAKQYSLERHENIVPVAVVDWIVKETEEQK